MVELALDCMTPAIIAERKKIMARPVVILVSASPVLAPKTF
jgi:hypothetical protein